MEFRPIDIARRLNLSTTTLRTYEEIGLVPKAARTASGYRIYTKEHLAYFICVREMLPAFDIPFIKAVFEKVQKQNIDAAYLLLNDAQVSLWKDRQIAEKFADRIAGHSSTELSPKSFSISEISSETGILVTTIRYWEKAGLIIPFRNKANRYRFYDEHHMEQLLLLHAIKLSVRERHGRHFLNAVEDVYRSFDCNNREQVKALTERIFQSLYTQNQLQMKATAALYSLCQQAENGFSENCTGGSE